MNHQRNKEIEDRYFMASIPRFKNSYGKGEETGKSKLFNIYHFTLSWYAFSKKIVLRLSVVNEKFNKTIARIKHAGEKEEEEMKKQFDIN